MKIMAGTAKNRNIKIPEDLKIKPCASLVKHAMFEITKFELQGAVVLDLFAGSGNLGLEALSRGAKSAVFSDNDFKCFKIIKENVKNLGFEEKSELLLADAVEVIERLKKVNRKFDIIIIDPPYLSDMLKNILKNLNNNDILSERGIIIIKRHKKEDISGYEAFFTLLKERKYGDTMLTFLGRKA